MDRAARETTLPADDGLSEEGAWAEFDLTDSRFARLVDDVPGAIVWEARPEGEQWSFTYVNAAAHQISGYPASEWVGAPELWRSRVGPPDLPAVSRARQAAAVAGAQYSVDYRWRRPDGVVRWFRENAQASEQDGHTVLRGLLVDITDQRRVADANKFLIEASAVLASSLDYRTTLANVARLAVPKLADWCTIDVLEDDGVLRNLAVAHSDPARLRHARELQRRFPPSPDAPNGAAHVVRTGRPELVPEVSEALLQENVQHPEQLRIARQMGLHSYMCVPMVARGRTLGAIALIAAESGRRYTEEDLALAEDLGRRAAMAVDNARLYHEAREEIAERRHAEAAQARLLGEVRTHRRWLDDILASIPGIVWETSGAPDNPDHRVGFVSDYAEQMLGYRVKEWLRQPGFWLSIVHPDDRERASRQMAERFVGSASGGVEFRWLRKDGSVVWAETRAIAVLDEDGNRAGMRGVTMDVTARKESDEGLRRRAAELARMARALERSNRELDQFAYAASHDLKAPLRGIANLSQWIAEDLQDQVGPETRHHLELMRGRVARMESMIEGMLQYARVGRLPLAYEPIDVAQLLEEVVDLLAPPSGFTVEVQSGMPTVVAKRLRIEQVFMNLIGNAIKHHNRPDGRVAVTARDLGEVWEFAVADDGPGIRPEYHEKVFGLFQTLEPRDKTETTGVGLAVVKKIVENEGGSIALESDEGAGATFRFTWRKEPRKGDSP